MCVCVYMYIHIVIYVHIHITHLSIRIRLIFGWFDEFDNSLRGFCTFYLEPNSRPTGYLTLQGGTVLGICFPTLVRLVPVLSSERCTRDHSGFAAKVPRAKNRNCRWLHPSMRSS